MPAIAAGIGAVSDFIGSLAAPAALAATDVAPEVAAGAADLGAGAVGATDLALPEISVIGAAPAAADLGAAGAASAVTGAGAADLAGGAGLGDVLGAGALGAGLGGLGTALSSVPGALGSMFVSPAAAAEAPTAGAAPTLGATGGAAPGAAAGGGGALGGAGGSAAAAAAPAGANNVVSGDFGALGYATPSSPTLPGFPNTSPSGQPLTATATDPSGVSSSGSSGGFGGVELAGLNPPGSPLGDNAVTALGYGDPTAAAAAGEGSNPLLMSLGNLGGSLGGLAGSAGNWIQQNPLMAAALGLGGGELLNSLLNPAKLPYQAQQEQIASTAQANAGQLQQMGTADLSYQTSGTLPPGLQAQVTSALQAANAATQSRFASLGLGNSTMLQDALNNNQLQATALAGTLQQQLAQTGTQLISNATSDLSVAGNVYSGIMQSQIAQDNQLEASVTQFAGALALASAIGSKGAAKTVTA